MGLHSSVSYQHQQTEQTCILNPKRRKRTKPSRKKKQKKNGQVFAVKETAVIKVTDICFCSFFRVWRPRWPMRAGNISWLMVDGGAHQTLYNDYEHKLPLLMSGLIDVPQQRGDTRLFIKQSWALLPKKIHSESKKRSQDGPHLTGSTVYQFKRGWRAEGGGSYEDIGDKGSLTESPQFFLNYTVADSRWPPRWRCFSRKPVWTHRWTDLNWNYFYVFCSSVGSWDKSMSFQRGKCKN